MTIEDLMQIQVPSASKKQEKLSEAAAAMYVITQEDIRRSGMTSIPELLRIVPGLDVAHVDANTWAISARGFADRFANKMLVLIDSRTVYTPLFSGVYWDVQDTLLEDIERIEVIRGPGAALWGANAVNGVINIITKQAKDTQGALVTAGGGNQEQGFGAVRYGGQLRDGAYYRFFAKYFDRDAFADASGQPAADSWNMLRGGFRTDWTFGSRDSFTFQGDFYNGSAGETVPFISSLSPPVSGFQNDRTHLLGGNLLGHWNRTFSSRSDISLHFYYNREDRRDALLGQVRHTVDLDFQHHIALGERHDIVWGGGYRFTTDQTAGSLIVSFDPSGRSDNLLSAFVQDEITLLPDRLRLTLGSKFEHDGFVGLEVQPNARLLWAPHPRHTVWAALSRAVRSPARADSGLRVNAAAFRDKVGTTRLVSLFGNPRLQHEEALAVELGYRAELSRRFSLDLTGFHNSYNQLRATVPGTPFFEGSPAPTHLVIPKIFQNALNGQTYGIELAPKWNLTSRWKLSGAYSWLRGDLGAATPGTNILRASPGINSPQHQWNLRSYLNLPGNLEFDNALYYVGQLSGLGVPSYLRFDTRVGWRLTESLEFSVVGQNLLDNRHPEFTSTSQSLSATQARRSVYGKLTLRF